MTSLKVLQIVPSIALVYGGPSQMVLGFAEALASQSVEVTILTTDANGDVGQPPLDVPLGQPVEQNGYCIRYFHCAPFRRHKFSLGLLQWLACNAHTYDIAHIHALFSPVSSFSAAIARAKSLPYVLRPLGTLDPADLRKKRRLKQLYATLLERSNLAGAAAIHFTSAQEAKISERFGTSTQDLILPLGVMPPTLLPNPRQILASSDITIPESGQPILVYMSRIDPKKGLDLLLPALEHLLANGIRFHFVLAGSNPQDPAYEDFIRHSIQASTLAQHTTITGFISGACKTALLQIADLFVLPSYYENFGIAVAEAMIAKVPVLISDRVHIYAEIEQASAGWVCTCTVDSLINQLRQALADATERQHRGTNARAYAKTQYSWEAIAQRAILAYQSLLRQ
jgi:glycosyltransferase involved in cell wall biosynthesis